MSPVLDTHAFVWMAVEPKRLSRKAKQLVERSMRRGGISVASITLWEISMMISRGRLTVQGTRSGWITEVLSQTGVGVLPITPTIAHLATSFGPEFPGDPADRLIGATARSESAQLVTADERMHASPLLKCVW